MFTVMNLYQKTVIKIIGH